MKPAILTFTAIAICFAQSPAFEVTSVKMNHSGTGMSRFPGMRNGTFSAENTTMRVLLLTAFGLSNPQLTAPGWIDSDRFDISAKAPAGVPDTEMKPLLQALLKDRFGLVSHLETKDMQIYNMVVAKDGLKIKPYDPNGPPMPRPVQMPGAIGATAGQQTMAQISLGISGAVGRPVVDKTGLDGRYAFFLQWGQLGNGPDQAPDIPEAVQQQLGLKLEPAKGLVQTLVVDHIERTPTEN